jgi:hypothetical protein
LTYTISGMIPSRICVPTYVHRLTIFFSTALHKHAVLFSNVNFKRTEQWIESSVRLFLHDRSSLQKQSTIRWLLKHNVSVWKNAEAIFSFEGIIRDKISDVQRQEEAHLATAWQQFYSYLDKECRNSSSSSSSSSSSNSSSSNSQTQTIIL